MPTENQTSETLPVVSKSKGGFAPLIIWLLFASIFLGLSLRFSPNITDITNQKILDIFTKYARFCGIVFGLLSLTIMYVLYIFRRIFRLHKNRFSVPIIMILSLIPWLVFGYQLVYREPRYTVLGRAFISFFGEPMFYTSIALAGLSIIWLLILPFKKK